MRARLVADHAARHPAGRRGDAARHQRLLSGTSAGGDDQPCADSHERCPDQGTGNRAADAGFPQDSGFRVFIHGLLKNQLLRLEGRAAIGEQNEAEQQGDRS